MKKISALGLMVGLLATLAGCDGSFSTEAEDLGEADIAITTVPAGVNCIVIKVGETPVSFIVTPGTPVTLGLGQLPLGNVSLTGFAYDATCSAVNAVGSTVTPTWLADAVTATIKAGAKPRLAFQFRRYNPTTGTASFDETVVDLSLSGYMSLALLGDGNLRTWGAGVKTPTQFLPAGNDVKKIGGTSYYGCALKTTGAVVCWGDNTYGQLGNNSYVSHPTDYVFVVGLNNVVDLAVGGLYACALQADGVVKCWGGNGLNQLGDGTTTNRNVPVAVTTLPSAAAIVSGGVHTCALLTNGTVRCWGQNAYGQLGNGTTTNAPTPVIATGLTGITSVWAGYYVSCATRADLTWYCWGSNYWGQMGDGSSVTNKTTPVVLPAVAGAIDVAPGISSTCWVKGDGTVVCSGNNADGQLGNATALSSTTLVAAKGLANMVAISAGDAHTCALRDDGTVWCWGNNMQGQLGTGNTTYAFVPKQVSF